MVRLLLVRHAETTQNAFMSELLAEIASGRRARSEFNQRMRRAPAGCAAGDDAELTERGHEQAQMLASAWAPLLARQAAEGRLLVFTSPFQRTLQTAAPLLLELRRHASCFEAVLLPALMETGGLTDAGDFREFDHMEALSRSGNRREALEHFKTLKWKPQGMTARQIRTRFPWARAATEVDLEVIGQELPSAVPPDARWWTGGYESRKRAERRTDALASWVLDSLRANRSGATGDDTTVVLMSHGGTISHLVGKLLKAALVPTPTLQGEIREEGLSTEGVPNTSVTSLLLPSDGFSYAGEHPRTNGEVQRFAAKLERFNDTSHLGPKSLLDWGAAHFQAKL